MFKNIAIATVCFIATISTTAVGAEQPDASKIDLMESRIFVQIQVRSDVLKNIHTLVGTVRVKPFQQMLNGESKDRFMGLEDVEYYSGETDHAKKIDPADLGVDLSGQILLRIDEIVSVIPLKRAAILAPNDKASKK